MSTVKEQLEKITNEEKGTQVVELEVTRNTNPYKMVGLAMELKNDTFRIAFSSKNDVVVDELTLDIQEIVSVRYVEDVEIKKIM